MYVLSLSRSPFVRIRDVNLHARENTKQFLGGSEQEIKGEIAKATDVDIDAMVLCFVFVFYNYLSCDCCNVLFHLSSISPASSLSLCIYTVYMCTLTYIYEFITFFILSTENIPFFFYFHFI